MFSKRKYWISLIFLLVTSCISGETALQLNETDKKLAEPIIIALESYYISKGDFPDELSTLSPNFIQSLPTTLDGNDFEYYHYGVRSYDLCFARNQESPRGCCYLANPSREIWECGTFGDE